MSLSPEKMIADLDAAIGRRGQMIKLIRYSAGAEGEQIPYEKEMRANVRAHGPSDLVEGGPDTIVVISPTELARTSFPLPRRDDHIVLHADPTAIQQVSPVYVDDVLVRVRLLCRG